MHYELEATIDNTYFDVRLNYPIISFFRRFNTTSECWYDVKLTGNDIKTLKGLAVTKKEKDFIAKIRENETVDIPEHVRF